MMKKITAAHVELLAFHLAREFLSFNEPIPDFGTRFPHRLESCILTPFQTYSGKSLYPGFTDKAAILFYLLIKSHPFQNGNKRIAITTLLTFLFLNGRWLTADSQEFYNMTVWVAQSQPRFKDQVVASIRIFIEDHLTRI